MISFLQEELEEIRAKDLYRKVRTLDTLRGAWALWKGREILLFCGNDYLGLSRHPRVVQAARQAIESHGVGSGAARLISGSSSFHEKLEEKIAAFKQKERALLFTTGYLANLGILTALAGKKDWILMDKLCHASIIDGARLSGAQIRVYPHKNYERLEEILEGFAAGDPSQKRIVVTDTVFSMDGDIADLEALVRLREKYGFILVVDDAHGTGVLGPQGRGATEGKISEKIDIVMGTLSKAVGCLGGFAAARAEFIEYLVNLSRPFIYATSLPPVLCASALEALTVIEEETALREKLWANARSIHERLAKLGFELAPLTSPIIPVLVGPEKEAVRMSQHLLDQGVLVPAIRTPTVPKGKARLRITASALHEEKDIEKLVAELKKI